MAADRTIHFIRDHELIDSNINASQVAGNHSAVFDFDANDFEFNSIYPRLISLCVCTRSLHVFAVMVLIACPTSNLSAFIHSFI